MANSAYIITRVDNSIALLEADYAPKSYKPGAYMNPGGKLDLTDENVLAGAIREWEEEMKLPFPVQEEEVSLLGVFSQEDGTNCFVFYIYLDHLDLSTDLIPGEVRGRKMFSLQEIEALQQDDKIFRAQFRFICWFSQVISGDIKFPVYDRVIPKIEPSFKRSF